MELVLLGFFFVCWLAALASFVGLLPIAGLLDRGLTPDEILDHYAQRSNGVTFSVSKPKRIEARSLADAAERMLARSKHHA